MIMDGDFKRQFRTSLIASLKQGFSINDIKNQLKNQNYSDNTINRLLTEFKSDIESFKSQKIPIRTRFINTTEGVIEDVDQKIIDLKRKATKRKLKKVIKLTPKEIKKIETKKIKKPIIPQVVKIEELKNPIKKKLGLLATITKSRVSKIKRVKEKKNRLKLYNLYYNLIIHEKRKLKEKTTTINKLNKRSISKFIKNQKSWIKILLRYIQQIKPLATPEINKFINTEEKNLTKELSILLQLRTLPRVKLKDYIKKEQTNLKRKRAALQKIINKSPSSKFKQIISKI